MKERSVDDWNVVATVFDQQGYREAKSILSEFGSVEQTEFYNVLVVKVADVKSFTEAISQLVQQTPGVMNDISRLAPSHANFNFSDARDFERKAKDVVLEWVSELGDRSFYLRLHRRGLRGEINSPQEERFLDDALLSELESLGTPGRITFEDPDVIIDVETVGNRAGVSKWSRKELEKFDFLRID